MDNSNFNDISSLDTERKYSEKIYKMASFVQEENVTEVPDPYYSGPEGFELVLDILEKGCAELLKKVKSEFN